MIRRLGHLVEHVTAAPGGDPSPFVALENLGSRTGTLLPETELPLRTPEPTGMTGFQAGDVLFGKLRPYLAKSWRADRSGSCSTELIVMRPRPSVDDRWLAYLAQSDLLVEWAVATSEGVKMPRTSWAEIRLLLVDAPTKAEQQGIADYLDAETAGIDRLVAALRSRVRLLGGRRRAVVSSALAASSETIVPVRRLVSMVTSGPRGWAGFEVDLPGKAFLRIANVARDSIELKLNEIAYVEPPTGEEKNRCRVQRGDVLMTITAAIGQVAIVPDGLGDAYISQHLALLRPEVSRVLPAWLALALWADDCQRQLDAARYGGTKQQLSLEDVREVQVPLAALPVQRHVVDEVLGELEMIGLLEDRSAEQILLLLERRKALITAAVTGQLAIPGVAA